jgi:cell division protein FtsI/penicillin-binding protein 2
VLDKPGISKGFASNHRVALLAGVVLMAFGGLEARLVWLQDWDRGKLLDSIEAARREIIVQNGRRGDILDSRGHILATSCSLREVGVDRQMLREEDEPKWPQLAELLGMPLSRLREILTTRFRAAAGSDAGLVFNFGVGAIPAGPDGAGAQGGAEPEGGHDARWIKLSDGVPESAYAEIQKLGVRGVTGDRFYRRDYPDNELAAHVIGFVNYQEQPVVGMERFADFYLREQSGWVESEKDGRREEMAQFRTREVPAADGYSVELSIDSTVQHIAESEVDAIVRQYDPQKVTIIVSDPRTGFILAMANYPTYNPNTYNRLPPQEQGWLQNAAVSAPYEPGSVFKIIAAAGALEDGLVTPGTVFDCTLERAADRNGVLHGLPREDAEDHFEHPQAMTVGDIISRSSDKGAAQLALRLGSERFYGYVRAFGFGQLTGFPGDYGENVGRVLAPHSWDGLTITRMAIGQSIDVTALQMHDAMGVIASGGELLRPQLIEEIRDPAGEPVFRFGRAVVRRVISERTARLMAGFLTGVTEPGGTATRAAIPGFVVAGKTGTAEKLLPVPDAFGRTVLRYSSWHHVSSFVGFFPAEDPQIEISVVVDDADARSPGRVGHGGYVSAPSFRRIGEQLIPYLNIHSARAASQAPILAMGGVAP